MSRRLLAVLLLLLCPLGCAADERSPNAPADAASLAGAAARAGAAAGKKEASPSVAEDVAAAKAAAAGAAGADAAEAPAGEGTAAVVRPSQWLVIGNVDDRGRRPLRPDAVFAAHLWDRQGPFPVAGEMLTGENGDLSWERRDADEQGAPLGQGPFGWVFARVERSDDGVMIANAQHAMALWVNGEPYAGDYYGFGQGGVPVALKAGTNTVALSVIRGRPSLELRRPDGPLERSPWRDQQPDLIVGDDGAGPVGLGLMNATDQPTGPLTVSLLPDRMFAGTTVVLERGLAPLETIQVALSQQLLPGVTPTAEGEWPRSFVARTPEATVKGQLTQKIVGPGDVRRRTFVSQIDGSVQYYAMLPPSAGEAVEGATVGVGADAGLVLTLHGAGVQAMGHARSYSARPDFWVVAPTNRSPFGFDWQDWGRLDAYEVLEDALTVTGTRRSRVYLTGHSMGSHGSWHLAANDPDGFAAVGPSAGWESFDSYGGRPDGALSQVWRSADRQSETLALIDNLAQVPAYVLHGAADDNVPVSQAESMIAALTEAGAPPEFLLEPGKGHWWDGDEAPGVDCVDWTGIFALFREHALDETQVEGRFLTVDPSIDARNHGLEVLQPERYGEPSRVNAELTGQGTLKVVVDNVRALAVHGFDGPVTVIEEGDDQGAGADFTASSGRPLVLQRDPQWEQRALAPGDKLPSRSGPFKRGLDQRVALVVGTAGSAEETAELWGRARALAQGWAYRAFGYLPVMTDREFLAHGHDGNLVLLGNADTNAAWDHVLTAPADAALREAGAEVDPTPWTALRAERGRLSLGPDVFEGDDIACLFVAARGDDDEHVVAVVGDTGPRGTRLHAVTAPLVSGVGIPDFVVFDGRVLAEGDRGVLATGWWTHDWRLPGVVIKPEGGGDGD